MIQINKKILERKYLNQNFSVKEISKQFNCSENKINYWLKKFNISKRSISEAVYLKKNKNRQPINFYKPVSQKDLILFGIGIGLYWGEGNKANKNTVRIGNSDFRIIRVFMDFLNRFYKVDKSHLKFHLHMFNDLDENDVKSYWMSRLRIKPEQFYKTTITQTGKLGTYKKKSEYGVLTLYYGNTKLRNLIVNSLIYPLVTI